MKPTADQLTVRFDDFSDEFLVVCPRCASCANVFIKDGNDSGNPSWLAPRRVTCVKCGYTKDWKGNTIKSGAAADWYFGLPLWLQTACCNETLWAHNLAHLSFLENFVKSKSRDTHPASLANKLPSWIKQMKNRDEILRAIDKLKIKLAYD